MMQKQIFLACVLLFAIGCGSSDPDSVATVTPGSESGPTTIRVQLNWYPESEHGGVYQAAADQTYSNANLKVEISPGGSQTPVAPQLELGRADFGFANADDVVLARRQGMDIVAVLAAMQNSPRCILVQESSGVTSFDDMKGITLQVQTGRLFVEFMRGKGILDGVQEVPYQGSVSPLVADRKVGIQAYVFAEPHLARQEGVDVRALMVSDLGWNPYSSVLITSGEMIRNNPEKVRRFVAATHSGWQNYLQDPKLGNEAILAANKHGMTSEALEYGSDGLRTLALPDGMKVEQVGTMSLQRWTDLVSQIDQLEPDSAGKVKPEDCFTNDFLPSTAVSLD